MKTKWTDINYIDKALFPKSFKTSMLDDIVEKEKQFENKLIILKQFLKEEKTEYQDTHLWLLQLLEDLVFLSWWCGRDELREACEEYKILIK